MSVDYLADMARLHAGYALLARAEVACKASISRAYHYAIEIIRGGCDE